MSPLAGLATAKYRIEHEEPDGTGAEGWFWVGSRHILLKVDGDYPTAGGKTVPVSATLSDIECKPRVPAPFTAPSTMTALPIEARAPFLGFKAVRSLAG